MKRSDLKLHTVFCYKESNDAYFKILSGTRGLYVYAFYDATGRLDKGFEGYLKETDSNKGFTLTRHILGKQVAAFFPFNQFEVINQ